jgi:hypothetical protein
MRFPLAFLGFGWGGAVRLEAHFLKSGARMTRRLVLLTIFENGDWGGGMCEFEVLELDNLSGRAICKEIDESG